MNSAAVRKMSQAQVRQRLRLELIDYVNEQPSITRCAECNWYWRGTVGEGKRAFAAHRKVHA